MSVNVNYCDTFLSALSKSYTSGDYIHTLGFASVGDGGAAMYKVSSDVLSDDVLSDAISCTVAGTLFNYVVGNFYTSNSHFFQLVPQYGKVYAEQFGVLPDDVAFAADNIKMLNRAVTYAAQNACVLTFASKGTYYVNPSSITAKSGMHIDGNGATLHIIGDSENDEDYIELFSSSSVVNNISIRNITLVGRKTSATAGYLDQGIHIQCSNLTVKNVRFKCFEFALHTYGGSSVGTYEVQGDGESATKTYVIPEIPNKNWLIDGCSIADTATGLMLSEIDGLTVKNSKISCIPDLTNLYHCIYMSSNCLNVRVANTVLCNVSGDAIHKAYAQTTKFDSSKNHFYNDLSIHNADSALDIGRISQNVMCDNVFATEVDVVLQLFGADNCIVSNSYFGQAEGSLKTTTFVYAEDVCNCWLQNSYVKYNGSQRAASGYSPSPYIKQMFADKKHRRMYIGQAFDIPNHWLKFTGCELESTTTLENEYYFLNAYGKEKAVYHEYWDNCKLTNSASKDFLRFKCINSIPAGVTIRNSYLKCIYIAPDTEPNKNISALFRFECGAENCNCLTECLTEYTCVKKQRGKRMPFVHYENNVLDKFLNNSGSSWNYHISTFEEVKHNFTIPEAVTISGSYVSGVYRLKDGKFSEMSNLDQTSLS